MPARKNISGQRFGRLTAVSARYCGASNHYRVFWLCRCDCGTEKEIVMDCLVSGMTKSCGCFKRENPTNVTHGLTGTPTNKIWNGMKKRCYQKNSPTYYKYGGRGIRICERWLGKNGFANFLADMGERPKGLTIERKDNNGDYSPENCRWASKMEQARNKRNTVLVLNGETLTECARRLGLNYKSLHGYHRMRGLSIEEAILRATANKRGLRNAPVV